MAVFPEKCVGIKPRRRRTPKRIAAKVQRKTYLRRWLLLSLTLLSAGGFSYHKIRLVLTQPEAIFVLGGHEEREKYAAQLAQQYPNLEVWVSSGSPPHYARQIFEKYGVDGDRLHLDYQAEDTVTNFTSLVDDLKRQNINSVYLITSENHMNRAKIVSSIVFGSKGINTKPIAVPSQNPPETSTKCLRDGLRSVLWLITGETGREWQPPRQISSRSSAPSPTTTKN